MDNVRYQVFVSSTYADLHEERRKVIQTLMEMDCIPAGMELFPAVDEEQWDFIKKVIDDCDYYLLIIGGRYGSMTTEGISYTEKEYDYAVSIGMKVVALIHGDIDAIPIGKCDIEPATREKLLLFRDKVCTGRLVKYWTTATELSGIVALSMQKTIKTYPAIGWVRANTVSNTSLLEELNEMRKLNTELSTEISSLRSSMTPVITDIADFHEHFIARGNYFYDNRRYQWIVDTSWETIFKVIGPEFFGPIHETAAKHIVTHALFAISNKRGTTISIDDVCFNTIKAQMVVYGLINIFTAKTVKGGMSVFWQLTPKGKATVLTVCAIRKSPETE